MNPLFDQQKPLPERVAVLETLVPTLQEALFRFDQRQQNQEASLNTITVKVSSIDQSLVAIITERSRWKDPMLYVTAISVVTAMIAVYLGH